MFVFRGVWRALFTEGRRAIIRTPRSEPVGSIASRSSRIVAVITRSRQEDSTIISKRCTVTGAIIRPALSKVRIAIFRRG